MPKCLKCGSGEAWWSFTNKENNNESYCDPCYKKHNLAEYRKALEEYHKNKQEEAKNKIEKVHLKKLAEIQRGGFKEPYCSISCYSKGGGEIASIVLHGNRGICGFCQRSVIPAFGSGNVIFPFRSKLLYICPECISRGKEFVRKIEECCMCGKSIK